MTGLNLGGSSQPRAKAGDYERALALVTELGGDKTTKAYLKELVEASAAHDKAREAAETAIADAKERDATAREAEDRARSEQEAASAAYSKAAGERKVQESNLSAEEQRLVDWAEELAAKDLDIIARSAAIQRAFDGFNKGE